MGSAGREPFRLAKRHENPTAEVLHGNPASAVRALGRDLMIADGSRRAIAAASTIPEAKHIRDAAEAARTYAKKARLGLDAQNRAAEIKLCAERKCGELLIGMAECGERAGRGKPDTASGLPTLADLGIEEKQSTRWQKIARIPLAEFERYLADGWALGDEITTAGLLARHDTAALLSSVSNEWYTPVLYVEAARRVMGSIDLDPASCPFANETVRASHYFTTDDNGLVRQGGDASGSILRTAASQERSSRSCARSSRRGAPSRPSCS